MKRVIRNLVYDTERAKQIWSEHLVTLYRKRTGEYFLFDSMYQEIHPLDYAAAKEWAKVHMDDESFGRQFGEKFADDGILHFKIPIDKEAKMRRVAEERGISLKALLVEMIDNL